MTTGVRRSTLLGGLCFLIAMIEGFDLQAAGVAAPTLVPALGLSPGGVALFFSSGTIGLVFGAIAGGRIADRFGRKCGLAAALACFGIFSLATSQSWDFSSLLAFRFLTGVGLGGAMPNLIAICVETARPGRSASSVGAMYGGMPAGGAIAAVIAVGGWHGSWREIFVIGGLAPILVLPLVGKFLPRLATRRHKPEAGSTSMLSRLFVAGRRLPTILLWTAFFLTLLILYLLLNWLPTLLVAGGIPRASAAVIQVVFNLAGAAASFAIGAIVDRAGPRMPLVAMFTLLLAALGLLATGPVSLILIGMASAIAGAALMAVQAILYGLAPAFYVAEIRGTGVGAAVAVGRLGSIAGPLVAGGMVVAGSTPALLFAAIIPIALAGGAAAVGMLRAAGPIRLAAPPGE